MKTELNKAANLKHCISPVKDLKLIWKAVLAVKDTLAAGFATNCSVTALFSQGVPSPQLLPIDLNQTLNSACILLLAILLETEDLLGCFLPHPVHIYSTVVLHPSEILSEFKIAFQRQINMLQFSPLLFAQFS